MQKPRSPWLLFFCVWSVVCGLAIVALGLWNGNEVAWSELSVAIVAVGGVIVFLSLLGSLASRGCTFCCNVGLHLFVMMMGLLVLCQIAFIIAALIKESEWVADLAKKYSSDDNVDHLKSQYDEFWPFVIGFGAVTSFGCLCAFLSGYFLIRKHKSQAKETKKYLRDPERGYEDQVKRRHQEVSLEMQNKYGKSRTGNVFSKKNFK